MAKAIKPTPAELAAELAKVELRPDAKQRTDALVRSMLASPPDPKKKPKK